MNWDNISTKVSGEVLYQMIGKKISLLLATKERIDANKELIYQIAIQKEFREYIKDKISEQLIQIDESLNFLQGLKQVIDLTGFYTITAQQMEFLTSENRIKHAL